jgi:hypothetical protein
MGGSSSVSCLANGDCGQPGVYGTLGNPAAGSIPGARDTASSWTDSEGNLWLFGGEGLDANGNYGYLNDLWKYDPSMNQWAWMGGSSTLRNGCCNQPGVYGTMGTQAAGNIPGSRFGTSNWTDPGGHFWLFGGVGGDETGRTGFLNDLWEFYPSTNEWAWMGGFQTDDTVNGWYGTLGTPAVGNRPESRQLSSSWTDNSGNLWLFGGLSLGDLNDLWEFNPSLNEWAWMNGSDKGNVPGVYGQLGTPAAGNTPDPRDSATNWTDGSGNFWLLGGGWGSGSNDLWNLNPSVNEWAWMGGSSTVYMSAVYGALGTPANGNLPGSRRGANGWTDRNGNLWLFGGWGRDAGGNWGQLNDSWKYQPYANAAAPTFSIGSGTYTTAQTVTISDATSGSTIYYTTNGSTPTISSNTYTGPIIISSTGTLEAIATASGYVSSGVASATYTIPPDFTFSINPASISVQPGQSGTATITVQDEGGFNSAISFTCSGLPAGAACSFSTLTVPTPSGISYTTLTVTTPTTAAALPGNSNPLLPGPLLPGSTLAVALCCIGWKKRRRLQMLLLLAVSVAGLSLLNGCGGASPIVSSSVPVISTVTVTAASGSLSHTTTFSLTVN